MAKKSKASPSQNHDHDSESSVYDASGIAPSSIGSSSKKRGVKGVDEKSLLKSEQAGGDYSDSFYKDASDSLYRRRDGHSSSSMGGLFSRLTGRKRAFIGAGIAASLASLVIAGFLFLLPLKILHIMTNLENRFFSTSLNAMQKESDSLFSGYVKKVLLPNKRCQAYVTKKCNPVPVTANPVSRLYKGWSNSRLEDKIAKNYGLEFGYNSRSGTYFMKTLSTGTKELSLNDFLNSGDNVTLDDYISNSKDPSFKTVSRAEIRQSVRDSLSKETRWKRVMYKYKVGRLLEEKYGIKRCITDIGCKISDKTTAVLNKPKNVAKAYVAERVLMPRSEILGTVFQCLYIDPNCAPEKATVQPCTAGVDCEANGTPQSKEERDIQSSLDKLIAKYASADAFQIYKDINDSGSITQYLVKRVVAHLWGDAAAKTAADKIPVIGWINLAAQIDSKLRHIGPAAKKLAYVTNSGSMVALYSTYRTYADEIKSGNVSATDVGSFTDSLGATPSADKGGTASAEQTPLYQSLFGGPGNSAGTSAFSGLSGTAYAAAAKPAYLCDNGKPPSDVVCPEESLHTGNSIASSVSDFINSPGMEPINFAASIWNWGPGKILGIIGGISQYLVAGSHIGGVTNFVLEHTVPYYSDAEKKVTEIAGQAMEAGVNYMIPNPFSHNMSGGRTFDLAAGGADISGNTFAHIGLGGRKLSDQEVGNIVTEQNQDRLQEYHSQSLIAQFFDTESDQSPVTKIAMAMPHSTNSASAMIASFFSNPFGRIFGSFGALFTPHTSAASPNQPDPFGITQYGYSDSDIKQIGDPEKYWDEHCSDNPNVANGKQTNDWNNAAANNLDENYMPENTATNPCLLIQATVGSVGATSDSTLLTADDTGDTSGASSDTSSASGGTVSGDAQQLAKQVLSNPNVSYPLDAVSPNGSTKVVLQTIASGSAAPVTCRDGSQGNTTVATLNPNILKMIIDLAAQGPVGVNALTDKCHSVGSNHYRGLAIDFECQGVPFDTAKGDAIAAKYGGKRNFETCGANYHWHYDFTSG